MGFGDGLGFNAGGPEPTEGRAPSPYQPPAGPRMPADRGGSFGGWSGGFNPPAGGPASGMGGTGSHGSNPFVPGPPAGGNPPPPTPVPPPQNRGPLPPGPMLPGPVNPVQGYPIPGPVNPPQNNLPPAGGPAPGPTPVPPWGAAAPNLPWGQFSQMLQHYLNHLHRHSGG